MDKKVAMLAPIQIQEQPEQQFTDEQIKNIRYLIEQRGLDNEEAIGIVRSDDEWNSFLSHARQGTQLKNVQLIEKIQKKIEEKAEAGFMEAAQKGGVLLAILMDKTYGPTSEKNGPMFNVNGRNVGIKVNFDFKPYEKTRK